MRDEIYDRTYQAGRAELHAGIDRAILRAGRLIAATFEAIERIRFAAPWREAARPSARRPGAA